MEGAIIISPGALTLFSLVVSGLCGAIALLYKSGKASDQQQIADLRADNKELRTIAFRNSNVTNKSLTLAEILAAAQQAGVTEVTQ